MMTRDSTGNVYKTRVRDADHSAAYQCVKINSNTSTLSTCTATEDCDSQLIDAVMAMQQAPALHASTCCVEIKQLEEITANLMADACIRQHHTDGPREAAAACWVATCCLLECGCPPRKGPSRTDNNPGSNSRRQTCRAYLRQPRGFNPLS